VQLKINHHTARVSLAVQGEVDIANVVALRDTLRAAIASASDCVIDLSELSFIGGVGVQCLLDVNDWAAARGKNVRFYPPHTLAWRVFEALGADRRLPFAYRPLIA
jgi:anti-anti-sigma factor